LPNVIAIPGGLPVKVGDEVIVGSASPVRRASTSRASRPGSTKSPNSSNDPRGGRRQVWRKPIISCRLSWTFHRRLTGLDDGFGEIPMVRIHLLPSEKLEGIRHFWPDVKMAIVPKPSPKIVPKVATHFENPLASN
jgi:hypothetical protein